MTKCIKIKEIRGQGIYLEEKTVREPTSLIPNAAYITIVCMLGVLFAVYIAVGGALFFVWGDQPSEESAIAVEFAEGLLEFGIMVGIAGLVLIPIMGVVCYVVGSRERNVFVISDCFEHSIVVPKTNDETVNQVAICQATQQVEERLKATLRGLSRLEEYATKCK